MRAAAPRALLRDAGRGPLSLTPAPHPLATLLRFSCMPTFMLYKGGARVEKLEGASEAGLRAILEQHK